MQRSRRRHLPRVEELVHEDPPGFCMSPQEKVIIASTVCLSWSLGLLITGLVLRVYRGVIKGICLEWYHLMVTVYLKLAWLQPAGLTIIKPLFLNRKGHSWYQQNGCGSMLFDQTFWGALRPSVRARWLSVISSPVSCQGLFPNLLVLHLTVYCSGSTAITYIGLQLNYIF